MVNIISISKLTDILVVLTLTVIIWVTVLLFLRDNSYYMVLALVLSVLAASLYIFLKIKEKPPPEDTGHYP